MKTHQNPPAQPPWLVWEQVTLRRDERTWFRGTNWTWRAGEQWAVLGPDDSSKSLLALAIQGQVLVQRGQIHYPALEGVAPGGPESVIGLVSIATQRRFVAGESSFHQSRWHRGLGEGGRTVADWLSLAAVHEINPFEIGKPPVSLRVFQAQRRAVVRALAIESLRRRQLIHLSNGEQRKVLLARALLRGPRLLLLDEPFLGLDALARRRLQGTIGRLMGTGMPVLVLTGRPDEIPRPVTHVLLVNRGRVVAQGPRQPVLRHPLALELCEAARAETSPAPALSTGTPRTAAGRREPLVELIKVSIRSGRQHLLRDVTWTIRAGERWLLRGANGAGKTTLLALIQGDHPQACAQNIRLFGLRPEATHQLWQVRQWIGAVSPELHLHYPDSWTCFDVVCSGHFQSVGLHQTPSARQRTAARRALTGVRLSHRAEVPLGHLPLGDQRLVLLARAIVHRPRLIILDEPCQGLDTRQRGRVMDTVDRVVTATQATLVFVTHHVGETPRCITHALRLANGRIVASGRLPAG